jgi:CheY-like chemotaxis protein
MDGVEMIRHLSAQGAPRPPAIVAVSAHATAHVDKLGGLPTGVTLLSKPVEPARFVEAVNTALDGS